MFWLFSILKGHDSHASQGCLCASLKNGSSMWVQATEDLAAALGADGQEGGDGQEGLACCSLWGSKELDMTE